MAKQGKKQVKKKNFFVRIYEGIKNFILGSISELKKVTWPTKQELIKSTSIVIASIIVFTIVVWVFDFVVGFLRNLVM